MIARRRPHEDAPDRKLVRRARRGDSIAFDALVLRYLRPSLAVAWEFTETREDAEDIVQEAFRRCLLGLDGFDDSRPFRPWFFTILRNVGRNTAAWRSRWGFEPLDDISREEGGDPLSELERAEIRARIDEGLEGLSPMQRTCFRLIELEGFDRIEVAEMLGLEDGTVRVHLHRARKALRLSLGPMREEMTEERRSR